MLKRKRSINRVAAVLIGVVAMTTGSAAVASAAPATFSPASGAVRESSTTALSWYADGVLAGSCVPSLQGASFLQHTATQISGSVGTCNNGSQAPSWFQLRQTGVNTAGSYSLTWQATFVGFPGYTVNNPTFSTPWTNGTSALVPSKVTLNNTVIGTSTNGHVISVSGVLNVTNLDGSLLTLS